MNNQTNKCEEIEWKDKWQEIEWNRGIAWGVDPSKAKIGSKGKVRLIQKGKRIERVWYEVIDVLDNFKFKVKLLNDPVNIDLKFGDIIEIKDDDIVSVPKYEVKP